MQPLPEVLRPQTIEDVVGQSHLLGENGVLSRLIRQDYLPSVIFWGPPGVGKTTLAYLLAKRFNYEFVELSGVDFSIKSLEKYKPAKRSLSKNTTIPLLEQAQPREEKPKVIFVDEIHRLNKSQQAQFLPYVERGSWILIGATTENPSFEIISPLLSRSQIIVLEALSVDELKSILEKGINYLKAENASFSVNPEVQKLVLNLANGDARLLLNALQAINRLSPEEELDLETAKQSLGDLHLLYDKSGEQHYDTISALHKSMRGSDPSAAVYYLGRMLEGGEDPLYVARRCIRFAAEDIGLADPQALVLANTAFMATEKIGMPESNVILTELVLYLAKAPKSNLAYKAYKRVQQDIQTFGNLPIPLKIRNAPTDMMQDMGYGKGYKYAHDYSAEELANEVYLPEQLKGKNYLED